MQLSRIYVPPVGPLIVVAFNGGKYASGTYFCRLVAIPVEQRSIGGKQGQTFTAAKEMLLAK
ncbi:MAG: hypothetical protein M1469_06345 [Bacteroidetes bacterium]|nr:hypothetical protein [Bacteroidota bacterium]